MMPRRFQEQAATGLLAVALRGRVAVVLWALATSAQAATVATPTFSPAGGTYDTVQTVAISTKTASASARIYYTTDGTTPTSSSTRYTKPVTVSGSTTLKAIATAPAYTTSAVASAKYTLVAGQPTFSPAGGTYDTVQTVAISTATPRAQIHYTTDGTTPTTGSPIYSAPITVSASATIQAIAVAP